MPVIETERLTLRPMHYEDWPGYERFMATQRAIYMGGPFGRAVAWGMFCHDIAQWSLFGHGALMIVERDSGDCVGQVGLNAGPLFPERELGWMLYSGAEGRGYAFEAASAFKAWAFETLQLATLVSYINPANLPSRRLAERLGAIPDHEALRHDPADLVYRHARA